MHHEQAFGLHQILAQRPVHSAQRQTRTVPIGFLGASDDKLAPRAILHSKNRRLAQL